MIPYEEVKMGKLLPSFNNGEYQDITFCVTEQCNFRCKYCYMYKKNGTHVMSADTAKRAVDFILKQKPKYPAAAWNFIGGEATLEMDLIDEITDYIKIQLYETNHEWFGQSVFNIETNGYLYNSEAVQNYRIKNGSAVQFAITIDGTKEKHDLSRVLIDGSGTYDVVEKNIQLWIKQIPGPKTTKSTFSSNDLPFLFSSIVNLWNLGIEYIAANVVFEDVWKEGDCAVYENQLMMLADYIIEHKLWNKYSVRFFDPRVGHPIDSSRRKLNFCGTGKMITVGPDGSLFPCIRFLDFCMSKSPKGFPIGNVFDGFDDDSLNLFHKLSIESVSDSECLECPIALGCMSCTGNCYDDTKGLTLFQRTKYHCDMQKIQTKANQYFWKQYSKVTGRISPFQLAKHEAYSAINWSENSLIYLFVMISDEAPSICQHYQPVNHGAKMNSETLDTIIEYSETNHFYPIVLTDNIMSIPTQLLYIAHTAIAPANTPYEKQSVLQIAIPVYHSGWDFASIEPWDCDTCILIKSDDNPNSLEKDLSILTSQYQRVVLSFNQYDLEREFQATEYQQIYSKYQEGLIVSIDNIVQKSLVVNIEGKVYPCLGFLNNPDLSIGTCKDGVSKSIYKMLSNKVCKNCGESMCMYLRHKSKGDIFA